MEIVVIKQTVVGIKGLPNAIKEAKKSKEISGTTKFGIKFIKLLNTITLF